MKKKTHAAGDLSAIKEKAFNRRSFLRNSVVAGTAVTVGTGMLESVPVADGLTEPVTT